MEKRPGPRPVRSTYTLHISDPKLLLDDEECNRGTVLSFFFLYIFPSRQVE